jgi:hypothetical protein
VELVEPVVSFPTTEVAPVKICIVHAVVSALGPFRR